MEDNSSYGPEGFSKRLIEAIENSGFPPRPTELARRFNRCAGMHSVTVHGARKWLLGESIPAQTRVSILAAMLNVSPQWLRFGDGKSGDGVGGTGEGLKKHEAMLLHDFRQLPPEAQAVVKHLVNFLVERPMPRNDQAE